MPDLTPADELRAASTRLLAATGSAPPCQHPGCGHCEGWHREDADGGTVCTGCDYDAHRYVSPGFPMPDGIGLLLADWLEATALRLHYGTHPEWQDAIEPQALTLARAINTPTEERA